MSKQDRVKMQTYVLRVNIHCDGCKDTVKKLIQNIDGVYKTTIDAEQGKAVVTGIVDPARIIKKLKNSGKHAELWGDQRTNGNNQNNPAPHEFNRFKMGSGRRGKDNKSSEKGEQQPQPQPQPQLKGVHLAQMQMKGSHTNYHNGFTLPPKDQKSLKFNMQDEEIDASDDDFDGSDDDDFDGSDDDAYNDEYEYSHGHNVGSKMTSIVGNGYGQKGPTAGMMMHGHPMNGIKVGGREVSVNFKKQGPIYLPVQMKGNRGKINSKNGNEGKKGNGDGKGLQGKKKKDGKGEGGGVKNNNGAKSEGGLLGFFGFGKKSKTECGTKKNNISNSVGRVMSVGGFTKCKKAGGTFDEFHDVIVNMKQGAKGGKVGKGGGGKFGQMGGMNNFPMGQVKDVSAVQGLPAHAALNGGYNYQRQGQPMRPPPSYPPQQYMPTMTNQQHQPAHGNGIYQPMLYARPHPHPYPYPSVHYMPPPPPMPSHPMNDPVTHIFSDENTESCSVM